MNSPKFKQRSLTDTLTLLCHARGGKFLLKEKVNQSEIGRQAGTTQTNVSRWYSGLSKPNDDNVNRLAKAFKISPAQMRGEMPINAIDGYVTSSPEDSEFIAIFQELPEELKHQVREQVKIYRKLNDQTKKES